MEYFSLSLFEITICPFGPTLEYEYAEELSVIPLRWYNLSIRLYNCERGTGYSCVSEGHQVDAKGAKMGARIGGEPEFKCHLATKGIDTIPQGRILKLVPN